MNHSEIQINKDISPYDNPTSVQLVAKALKKFQVPVSRNLGKEYHINEKAGIYRDAPLVAITNNRNRYAPLNKSVNEDCNKS